MPELKTWTLNVTHKSKQTSCYVGSLKQEESEIGRKTDTLKFLRSMENPSHSSICTSEFYIEK